MRIPAAFAFLLLVGATAPGLAQDMTGDAEAGKELALGVCSRCHVVADIQHMPTPPVPDVPAFQELANDSSKTEFYLRSFFRTPHRVMPNFMLSADEIDNIVAYIFSLKDR